MTSRPLSVALLGFWHVHAAEYAADILELDDARLTAVWDPDPGLARAGLADLAEHRAIPDAAVADDLDSLLARADIDAVVVTTATVQHREVIRAAIRAGKHVFTEKLLAPTVAECEELIAAARDRGVILLVSLPQLGEPAVLAARRLVEDGSLGALTYCRIRMAHDGWLAGWLPDRFGDREEAIGGALTDLGCHPVYLTQMFLGPRPSRVTSTYARVTGRDVEDNAVVTTTYENGAIGVIEASFVATPGASCLELRGTKGSLLSGFGTADLLVKGTAFDPDAWARVPLPPAGERPIAQWLRHIRNGEPGVDNLRRAVDLTRLVVAANTAAESGTSIGLPG